MFECSYKYELVDSLISSKYIYKAQKRTKDKIIAIMLPILLVCMIAMLIADIINKKNLVWDIVLVVAIIILQVMYLIIPLMLKNSQIKAFKAQKIAEMDLLTIKIDENLCTETMYKDNKEMSKSIHNLKNLTSYLEDSTRLILVFNEVEFVCLRKQNIKGDLEKLKTHLVKVMSKTKKRK